MRSKKLANRISGNFPDLDQDDISLQLPPHRGKSSNQNRMSMNAP